MKNKIHFTCSLALVAFIVLLMIPGLGWGQTQLAAWTFDATPAAPNTPSSVAANLGTQSGTATIYADGTNGSSTWITATVGNELSAFAGSTLNDPRGTPLAGFSYCPIGGTGLSANGKCMVIKLSMTGFQDPILTYATRNTATGFQTQTWAWSTDNSTYTTFGTITPLTTTFVTKSLDLSSINSLDQATAVYLRITFTGATNATGNNRLDNIVLNATSASAGGPTKLAITSINGGTSPSVGIPFNVIVQSQDGSSIPANVVSNTDFTLSLATGTGTIGGTLTGTVLAGFSTATVTGVTYNNAESGVSIAATRTGGDVLTAGTSSTFTVLGAADHLAFVNLPTTGLIATNLNAFTVEARRTDNSVDANYVYNITVVKASGSGNLTGTTVKAAVAGTATFNDLQLDAADIYTLNASSGSLTNATSGNIEIVSTVTAYRSKISGNWNTNATWEAYTGTKWINAFDYPVSPTRDVTIQTGHTVIVPLSYNLGTAKNLIIESGATLYANSITGSCFVYVYGDILNEGTIGGAADVIGFDIEGTSCQLSGNGSFIASRIAKFTTTNPITNLTFNQNVTLTYTSASSAALRNGVAATTTFNMTLISGKQLNVSNAKIDLTGCTLTLKSNSSGTASLLDNGTISGMSGTNVIVERYIPGAASAWHFLSSPVAAQAISPDFTVSPATEYDFFTWYEQGLAGVNIGKWVNFKNTTILPTWNDANGSTNFVVGKGYLVQYQAANPTKIFTGMLNTGTVNFPMTISGTGTYAKTNLAGNPYPSSIDWKSVTGWDKSKLAVSGTSHNYYIWNDGVSQYGVYNDENSGDVGTNGVNRYIAPMQGFFVQTAAAGDLSMTNAVRVHSSQTWLKSGGNEGFRLKVIAPENKGSDEILFELGHNSSLGGAAKWYSFVPTAPSLSTPKSGTEYSISFLETLTNETVIPVSFKAGVDGQYTLDANLNQLPNAQVYLLDNKLVKTQNLSENPVYTFTASKTDDASRFVLHFGNVFGINETANPQPFSVYSSNNTVYVAITKTGTVKGEVYVYNTLGQVMALQNLSGDLTKINLDASTGYYLVKVVTAESTYTAKVFVKQQ